MGVTKEEKYIMLSLDLKVVHCFALTLLRKDETGMNEYAIALNVPSPLPKNYHSTVGGVVDFVNALTLNDRSWI